MQRPLPTVDGRQRLKRAREDEQPPEPQPEAPQSKPSSSPSPSPASSSSSLPLLPPAPDDEHSGVAVDSSTVGALLSAPLYGVSARSLNIGEYIAAKRVKVRAQFVQQTAQASAINVAPLLPLSAPSTASPSLFSSLVFWVDGLTSPPAQQLLPVIYAHGGSVENVLVPLVTHCLADSLPSTKVREWKEKSRRKRWWLQARWVTESVRAGRRLPEHDWLPHGLRERGLRSVAQMMRRPDDKETADEVQLLETQEADRSDGGEVEKAEADSRSVDPPPAPPPTAPPLPAAGIDPPNTDIVPSSPAAATSTSPPSPPAVSTAADTEPLSLPFPAAAAASSSSAHPLSFRALWSKPPTSLSALPPAPLPDYPQQPSIAHHPYLPPVQLSRTAAVAAPAAHQEAAAQHQPPLPAAPAEAAVEAPTRSQRSLLPPLPPFPPPPTLLSVQPAPAEAASPPPSHPAASSSVLLPVHMSPGSSALASGRLSGRSTLNDPHFVRTFFAASRLHFIGSWKRLFQSLVPSLLSIKPRFPASAYTAAPASAASPSPNYVLHCDLDCFFASIAERDNPALRGKPVAVCHAGAATHAVASASSSSADASSPSSPPFQSHSTSSISSCNYVARSFGLHADMSIGRARKLCPDLCVVPYVFSSYAAASESIYRIFFALTHRVQPVSLDEAYVELPASLPVQDVQELAQELRRRVEAETGVQLSIGISHSLLLARLATKAAKPNSLFYLPSSPPTSLLTYMSALSVSEVPGIGWVAQRRLESELSVRTCGELQRVSRERLQSLFGQKQGSTVYDSCRGIDHRQLVPVSSSSTSAASTPQRTLCVNINYGIRFTTLPQVAVFLSDLSDELLSRLTAAAQPLVARALTLKLMVRHPQAPVEPPHKFLGHGDCTTHSRSSRLEAGGVGGGEQERDRNRLRVAAVELWEKMRAEWEIKVEDLRGISLQFGRLELRAGGGAGPAAPSPFSAYGFKPVAASSERRGEDDRTTETRADCEDVEWEAEKEQAMEQALDEAEEWKEDGMEEDMEDDDGRAQQEEERQSASPPAAEPEQPVAVAAAGTKSSAETPAATPVQPDVSVSSLPPQLQAQLSTLLSQPGRVPISLPAALNGGSVPSSSASSLLASATVSVSIDQLVQLIASVAKQQQQSSPASSGIALTTQTVAHAVSSSSTAQPLSAAAAQPLPPASTVPPPAAAQANAAQASLPARSAPSISSVVDGVAAAKERQFLDSLPPFSAVDRAVVAALPMDVRQELAAAYKKKRSMLQDGLSPAQQPQSLPPPARPAPAPSRAATAASDAARLPPPRSSSPSAAVDLPSFSEVDPSVLAALPPSIRDELQREYARRERSAAASLRQPAVGAAAGRGGRAGRRGRRRGGGAAGGAQADRMGGVKPLHAVSIAEHFAALEHDRKQETKERTTTESELRAAGTGESREDAVVLSGKETAGARGEREEKHAAVRPTRRQLDLDVGQETVRVSAEEMERKYDTEEEVAVEDERAGRRAGSRQRRRVRVEKETEKSRRDAMRPANLEEIRFLQHTATARAAAAPLTKSGNTAAVASPLPAPPADSSSPQSELVAAIHASQSSFLSVSALQPQLSLFLRTARASYPHAHYSPLSSLPCCQHAPAAPCSCAPHCLCCRSPLLSALQGLLQAQTAMGNLQLVAGLLRCLRSLVQVGDREREAQRQEADTSADSQCCCFDCSVALLLQRASEAVIERYGAVVKSIGVESSDRTLKQPLYI